MSPITRISDLASKVENQLIDTHIAGETFLPYNKLTSFVTRKEVEPIIKDINVSDSDMKALVDFVLNDAKRVFLILVMMTDELEKVSLLQRFKLAGLKDDSLPIGIVRGKNGKYYGYSLEKPLEEPQFSVFSDWERADRTLFESYQWIFTAPVFDGSGFRFRFHQKRVLPYLKVAPKPVSSGFFGEVSRIEIHPAHILVSTMLSGADTVAIAVKKAKEKEELAKYFDKEADNLEKLQKYTSPHLIKPIAAYQIREERCLIFPWADGGNLDDYWQHYERKSREIESLRWLVLQFVGISSALEELHEHNCRHGDLKPENILWFKDNNDMGTLQIADLGLAAFHEEDANTNIRQLDGKHTSTPSGTSRYEPPEMDRDRNSKSARSRQYDVWSMGCILLELLTWLCYGYQAVKIFKKSTSYFWQLQSPNRYVVHPYVIWRMNIMDKQLQDDTAYKDLLHLVRTKLLVVEFSEMYESQPKVREIAQVLRVCIDHIQQKCQFVPSYLTPVQLDYSSDENIAIVPQPGVVWANQAGLATPPRTGVPKSPQASLRSSAHASDEESIEIEEEGDGLRILVRAPTVDFESDSISREVSRSSDHQEESSKNLVDVWESTPDNNFATNLFQLIRWNQVKPDSKNSRVFCLCRRCNAINSTQLFESIYDLSLLKHLTCDLCKLLFEALKKEKIRPPEIVRLRQDGAVVGLEGGSNLLSIYVEPGPNIPQGAQLGLPKLLKPASPEQFTLLKEWIRVCDSTHHTCRRNKGRGLTMPTRLIELGDSVRLVDSASIKTARYVALSHCWGPLKDDEKFCTSRHNIEQLKNFIRMEDLPRTFRDTVRITRGLGLKYIWIDSLCIIQDDEDDWERESGKMEQVFSDAYCTIGASSANSSLDGLITDRDRRRDCVQLQTRSAGRLYVCPAIDDFHEHVENGKLNRRGWVLQERALSRRSIYFTTTQVYWECGQGVQCETLARLHNSKAALLGDANFPKSALEYYRDGRQVLIQDLYERYSGLAFTKPSDRPVAILGLQGRLATAFHTQAAYGCFAVYFARGILWKRLDEKRMKGIVLPTGRSVPSWSFFSKEGPIKYMELKFKEIDWATEDFENPLTHQPATDPEKSSGLGGDGDFATLRGLARRITMTQQEMEYHIIFDEEGQFNIGHLRCVVFGRDKVNTSVENPKYYVLVIQKIRSALEAEIYQRVGVASLKPEHVEREGSWVKIT